MAKASQSQKIEEIIQKAVEAGRIQAERTARDAFKATEKRLYALPILKQKIADDKERLADLKQYGTPERSKSIVRFTRSGARLSPDEMLEAVVRDITATIASDEYEVETVEKALGTISGDYYYLTVTGRYVDNLTDEEVADKIPCDTTTVWRNRKRLVQRLAVRLYGADALK